MKNESMKRGAIYAIGDLVLEDTPWGDRIIEMNGWEINWPNGQSPYSHDEEGHRTICGFTFKQLKEIHSRPSEFLVEKPPHLKRWINKNPPTEEV